MDVLEWIKRNITSEWKSLHKFSGHNVGLITPKSWVLRNFMPKSDTHCCGPVHRPHIIN
jgi:hypothetical protein